MKYLIILLVVFGVNLLPAFGPPTWTLLVVARWQWHQNPVWLVLLGVIGAGSGRFLLAHGARALRSHFPRRYRDNLTRVEERLMARRRRLMWLLALFVVSPLPSAQLFLAAGLLDFRILPLSVAFMVGRVFTYSLYVSAAVAVDHTFSSVLRDVWGSPWSIGLQLLLLGLVVALPMLPWDHKSTPRS